jgi:hypothetical protein
MALASFDSLAALAAMAAGRNGCPAHSRRPPFRCSRLSKGHIRPLVPWSLRALWRPLDAQDPLAAPGLSGPSGVPWTLRTLWRPLDSQDPLAAPGRSGPSGGPWSLRTSGGPWLLLAVLAALDCLVAPTLPEALAAQHNMGALDTLADLSTVAALSALATLDQAALSSLATLAALVAIVAVLYVLLRT